MRAAAVDVDFLHHGKTHAVIELAKLGDLPVAAAVLRAKLVARKAQHHQALVAIGLVQLFQTAKLRREAAGARGVDDQHGFAFVLAQLDGFALDAVG